MNLTEQPEIVDWPPTHYVFVEKTGATPRIAPEAWQALHALAPPLREHNQVKGGMSLYRMNPNVYRAGFVMDSEPVKLPQGLAYEKFAGEKYSRFVLTGPYSDLPAASGRVWEIVNRSGGMVRGDYAIEHYLNDPFSTPPEKLVTEILIPTD